MKKLIQFPFYVVLFSVTLLNPLQATENHEKQVVIQIKEMTCQLCAYLVNKELRDVEGVISTKASIKEHQVKVIAKSDVDNEKLKAAIYKLNYTPEIVSAEN
ncbi:hypothetical protein A1D29_03995 [Pasteurellaceae bacterium Orientalotternb1]|nr:hypothetical protein A1D29_03995 [Pasteurellaceae bacterium Orientalotternb1]